MSFDAILSEHLSRYPLMRAEDVVKLAYQNAYGPGHLLKDAAKAEKWFISEWEACGPNEDPVYVPIGRDMCRVSLYRCREMGLDQGAVFGLFRDCAKAIPADGHAVMAGNLNTALEMIDAGSLNADPTPIHLALAMGKALPQPAHSVLYRERYNPAYRVVRQRALKALLKASRSSPRTP